MTLTTESLRAALDYANLQAILHVIRAGESSQDAAAYRTLYGGGTFDSFDHHPNRVVTAGGYTSTAAGAYQILYRSWLDFCAVLGQEPPFTPEYQDMYAVWAIRDKRKALPEILAGDLEGALAKLSYEWASLPPARYGQRVLTMDRCRAVYLQYGGKLNDLADRPVPAPIEERGIPYVEPAGSKSLETPMAPIFLALLPTITAMIPELVKVFGAGATTEVAKRNVAAATVVTDALVKATSAPNLQAAVEAMEANKSVADAARKAVVEEPALQMLMEIGGGVQKAREVAADPNALPYWRQGAFAMGVILVPLVYMVTYRVLWGEGYSEQLRTVVVTAILSGLLGALTGFFFGSMFSTTKRAGDAGAK